MNTLIKQGLAKNLIRFEYGEKYIVYIHQNKRRNYENPEEQVQAEAFLTLALDYQYPPARFRQYVAVTMGSEVKEASHLYPTDVRSIQIPIPPLSLQQTIVAEIRSLEQQAAILREQAQQTLEQAKVAVERLIFGEPA